MAVHVGKSVSYSPNENKTVQAEACNEIDFSALDKLSVRDLRIKTFNLLEPDVDDVIIRSLHFLRSNKAHCLEIIKNKKELPPRERINKPGYYGDYEVEKLSSADTQWLVDDIRACIWFLSHFEFSMEIPNLPLTNEDAILDFLLSTLDLANFKLKIDKTYPANFKIRIINLKQYGQINNDKIILLTGFKKIWYQIKDLNKLAYLISDNGEELKWTGEYLKNKNVLALSNILEVSNNHSVYKAQILASTDRMNHYLVLDLNKINEANPIIFLDTSFISKDTQELFTSKLRMGWSNAKKRARDKKKGYHSYLLPSETKKKLSIISLVRGKSESQVIDELINNEYKKPDYSYENGKAKYQLS